MHHNPRSVQFRTAGDLRKAIESLGCDLTDAETMLGRGQPYLIRLDNVPPPAAVTVKQAFVAQGGDAAIRRRIDPSVGSRAGCDEPRITDMLLVGTWEQYQAILPALRDHPTGEVRRLADDVTGVLLNVRSWPPAPTMAGDMAFEWGSKTFIMGILNVTPDSFSGDGLATDVDAAVRQAQGFVEAGADILDIGGESTRPGSEPIDADEELRRVLPPLRAIAAHTDVPISIDTYKAEVAAAALDAGAHIVNDVWGLRMDRDMASVVADYGVPVIVMHNRSRPKNAVQEQRLGGRYIGIEYANLMGDILRELRQSIEIAVAADVDPGQIIVDPGIGFGKTVEQNLTIIDQLDQLRSLGRPILVGPSRKSFIGYTLDKPAGDRLLGTAATVALAIARGADMVRVHDVSAISDVVRMSDAIIRQEGHIG